MMQQESKEHEWLKMLSIISAGTYMDIQEISFTYIGAFSVKLQNLFKQNQDIFTSTNLSFFRFVIHLFPPP